MTSRLLMMLPTYANNKALRFTVYCLDREPAPDSKWDSASRRASEFGGFLSYKQQDVQDSPGLDATITAIADTHARLDGVIAAAGVQHLCAAAEWTREEVNAMLDVNFTGVMMTATSAARAMFRYRIHGSMCFVASMSGSIANRGLLSPVSWLPLSPLKSY